jgi:hypothetical protein
MKPTFRTLVEQLHYQNEREAALRKKLLDMGFEWSRAFRMANRITANPLTSEHAARLLVRAARLVREWRTR